MSTRLSIVGLTLLSFGLCWCGVHGAPGQQEDERKQTLIVHYPNPAIVVDTKGTRYNGLIYVSVFPVTSDLMRKHGSKLIATAELGPSMRDVMSLPLGEYEVHYAM